VNKPCVALFDNKLSAKIEQTLYSIVQRVSLQRVPQRVSKSCASFT